MKTYTLKAKEIERTWRVVDADGETLGRLSTRVASLLRGKHKPTFTPSLDMGDPVVVVNASKVRVTGNKLSAKTYARHSGYPGGLRVETLGNLLRRRPEEVIRRSVRRMLPDTKLGDQLIRRLRVYSGPEHPHGGQRPVHEEKGASA